MPKGTSSPVCRRLDRQVLHRGVFLLGQLVGRPGQGLSGAVDVVVLPQGHCYCPAAGFSCIGGGIRVVCQSGQSIVSHGQPWHTEGRESPVGRIAWPRGANESCDCVLACLA
jgi:hypothetical protein